MLEAEYAKDFFSDICIRPRRVMITTEEDGYCDRIVKMRIDELDISPQCFDRILTLFLFYLCAAPVIIDFGRKFQHRLLLRRNREHCPVETEELFIR